MKTRDEGSVEPVVTAAAQDDAAIIRAEKDLAYRKKAFLHYKEHRCVWCGFAVKELLEVAHLDCDRKNCSETNLALLCPTCHRMHDVDLLSTEEVRARRDRLHTLGAGPVDAPRCHWCAFGMEADFGPGSMTAVEGGTLRLCPTCHRRAEVGMITAAELQLRLKYSESAMRWKKLSKDAAVKAGRHHAPGPQCDPVVRR